MDQVYVVVHKNKKGAGAVAEIHTDADSANAAAAALGSAEVKEMSVTKPAAAPKASKAKAAASTKAKPTKKAAKADPVDDNMDVDDEEEVAEKPAPTKKAAAPKKEVSEKSIPEGKTGALEGLSIIFTGTFESMDRDTQKATAKKYGAKVISNLAKTDYVVLGAKAGPKKLDEIEALGLDTVNEEGFFELLRNGVPQEKLDSMAEKEPAAKKQKK